MSGIQEPFTVPYCGVSITVTPVVNGLNMQYLVTLPQRVVLIETKEDDQEINYWVEIAGGRTKIAEEIGALIESRDR